MSNTARLLQMVISVLTQEPNMPKSDAIAVTIREEASLDDRIADAFEHGLASGQLAKLLDEVKKNSIDAQRTSKEAEARALDPKLRPADVAAARWTMDDANFRSKRMDAAAEQLRDLLTTTKADEEAQVRKKAHEAAIAERDQLVKDLAAYEDHALAILELIERISASNAKLHMDEQAERIARGAELHWSVRHDDTLPKLVEVTRLPKFRRDGTNHGYHWPPQRTN
jgi:predicted ATP-grasp superfamily ATP-dependent carboligase